MSLTAQKMRKSLMENFMFCAVSSAKCIILFTFLIPSQKMPFTLHKKLQLFTDLVKFTEEIFNGKLHFSCSVKFLSTA